MTKTEDEDEKKALKVRKSVANKERGKIKEQVEKLQSAYSKYTTRLKALVANQEEYDALVGTSSTAKKPAPESDSDETIASMQDIKAKYIFDTFMKRLQTEVLSGLSPEQLRTYVSNFTVDAMQNEFMDNGKNGNSSDLLPQEKRRRFKQSSRLWKRKGWLL